MLVLPTAGALLARIPLGELLTLPLAVRAWDPLPFDPPSFGLACVVAAVVVLLPLWLARPAAGRSSGPTDLGLAQRPTSGPLSAARLLVWGGLLFGAAVALALAGLPGASQPALVLGVTLALAGQTERRTGTSLLTKRSGYVLALFPVSALLGWLFHWLNLFLQLWIYPDADAESAIPFVLVRTLDYATLLPALLIGRQWLASWRPLLDWSSRAQRPAQIHDQRPLAPARAGLAAPWLALSGLGLTAAAVWPDWIWPLTWLSPLLLAMGLQAATGRPGPFAGIPRGDWSRILSPALAALLLGLLIQGWNQVVGPTWVFQLPLIQGLPLFGLPVPAYPGLLPLGLLGLWVADQLARPWRRRPLGRFRPFPVRLSIKP